MDWQILKPRFSTIFSLAILIIILVMMTSYAVPTIGGADYMRFPFKIRQISCGSSLDAIQNCTHPWILGGIVMSILFWIIIYVALSFLFYKIQQK